MKRMFICDPVCVLPFGHNAPAMLYYRSFFAHEFDKVECCVGLPLPETVATKHNLRRYFSYLYNQVLPTDPDGLSPEAIPANAGTWPNDTFSCIAKADYAALIAREAMRPSDVILLPSADFYSIHGLMEALRDIPASASPRVLLRMIGVMENASHVVAEPLKHLCSAIEAMTRAGYPILVAAETPIYARHLAAGFDIDVAMLPYPLLADMIALPRGNRFVVASAGSARHDKGFLDLLPIIREVRRHDENLDIEFRIQSLTDRDVAHAQVYSNQLYAMPGVELLPPVLSEDEMTSLYAGCHAVLLPYDPEVYRLRGSAVLMEAVAYGRYAIGRANLGFSSQIEYYQNGVVCSTTDEFARSILDAAALPGEVLQRQLKLARLRYDNDTTSAYRSWMEARA